MSTNITFNGVVYPVPTQGDPAPWGPPLDRYLVALGAGAISPSGGSYPLMADLNLGNNFGVLAKDFSSAGALPATAGFLRLTKTSTIEWRNNTNSGDNILAIDGSDNLTYNGSIIVAGLGVLPSGDLFVGSAGNVPVAQPLSGDATLVASGALTIANGAITNAKVNNSAAIAYSKLSLTSSIVNADIANAAAIAYSKLALSSSIVNGDLAGGVYSAITGLGSQSQDLDMNTHKVTNVTNGSGAQDAATFSQIKYFQAQTATSTTETSTTSSTYTGCTGMSVAIIPTSASNRVKISVSGTLGSDNGTATVAVVTVKRGSTDLSSGTGFSAVENVAGGITIEVPCAFVYIDSPATTSSTTYQLFIKSTDNSHTVRWNHVNCQASIIVEEIV